MACAAAKDGEVNAKPIPGLGVTIFQVVAESGTEVGGQSDVVEFSPPVGRTEEALSVIIVVEVVTPRELYRRLDSQSLS